MTNTEDLAPTGVLRASINLGNAVLTNGSFDAPGGITVDIAHELGRRLSVPVELVLWGAARQSVDAVRGDIGRRVLPGDRERPLPPVTADDLRRPHQAGDPLAADVYPGVGELGVDPRRPVDLPVVVERLPDLVGEHLICQLTR